MDQSTPTRHAQVSVLSCFPPSVGRDVAIAVVKALGASLANPDNRSLLCTDREVTWTMEVLSYGLTLPLDGDTVRLCVGIYLDWLMALVSKRDSIPPPISREPNVYAQKIVKHLYSLFLPRSDQMNPVYPSLCQQVLCAVQSLARESPLMTKETWETLLHFLLRINHTILAPPTPAGGISDLSMAVLLEVWLLSCSHWFPSHSLWQTCRQMLSSWRHQPVVVQQWTRIVSALTSRLLQLTFGPTFPHFKVPDEDAALIPADMDDVRVPHTWYRFLHLFSSPVDLCGSTFHASTPLSQEGMFIEDEGELPAIFFRAMRGVSTLVDAFLGVSIMNKEPTEQLLPNTGLTTRTPAFRDRLPSFGINVTKSPFKDRLPSYGISRPRSGSAPPVPVNIRSMSASPPLTSASPPYNRLKATNVSKNTSKLPVITSAPSLWTFSTQTPSVPPPLCFSPRPSPSPLRCNVDSLLHLFGCWLFDAALIWRDSAGQSDITAMSETWVAGRAEACGTLCRIFTCKKTGEGIMPLYLSRFYMVLLKGLQISEMECPPVLASILLNSTCLFCCDLKGINLLLPVFISALENVLLDRELLRFKSFVCPVDLRRASILILLSLLPVPLQFGSVQTEVLTDGDIASDDVTPTSFLSLKPRLIGILIGALQTETDTYNTQLLLGAMLSFVQDLAMLEGAGQGHQDCDLSRDNRTSRNTGTTGSTRLTQGSNAAAVLWAQLVRLLTQRLTAHWRNDSAVCLSVLEVLEGLAKVEVRMEESEMRRAVSSVCTYIVFQCSRPPPSHSSELHSIIVAAFFCLNVWLTQHPTLLDHQECLLEVLEIVELGISGSKSRQEQEVRWKEKKELNPASLRVKEAAEMTLSCVMQVSGACPVVNGSLNEDALIGCSTSGDGLKKFRYFVVDGSMILAMLERGPGHEQEQHPSLTMIMRGPSGCHTWTLQLHLQPREGRSKKATTSDTCSGTAGMKSGIKHHVTAEKIDVSPVKADQSIPALHEIVTENMQHQLDRMRAALKKQQQMEARPLAHCRSVIMTSCRLPPPVTHFQTARLFLSHLGLLTPETVKDPGITGVPAQLVTLDSSLPGFSEDLRKLDQLPSKNCDSAFIFYMKAGQRTATEMLKNVESRCSVQSQFLDFLSSIGCTAKMGKRHMGGINTSSSEFHTVLGETGGSMFDGRGLCLMFTDALTEITFIVPSTLHIAEWSEFSEEPQFNQHGHSEVNPDPASKPTSFKVEDIKSFSPASLLASSESNVLIVWVERFEDIENFPLSDLLSCLRSQTEPRTPTETSTNNNQLIFIHPLKTGLYRICFHGNATSKFGLIMPLVSGHVVSRRSLGFLVREMVINCCHRRRLESDSAPPPHIKRKHMISDIMLRYRSQLSEPAFYSSLFREVCPHDLQ